jgi:hypothetical protein
MPIIPPIRPPHIVEYEFAMRQAAEAQAIVLTLPDFVSILQDKAKNNPSVDADLRKALAGSWLGKQWNETVYKNLDDVAWTTPVSQAAVDVMLISKAVYALRITGLKSYVKTAANGKPVIIITGYAAQRNALLQGTRFLASHPKMIKIGLGMKGVGKAARSGFHLGLVISIGIESLDFMLNDERTMYDLVGAIGIEAVKGGLAVAVGVGLAKAAAGTITLVVAPLMVLAVTVVFASIFLNALDNHFQLKEKLIEALKESGTAFEKQAHGWAYAFDRGVKMWISRR